MSFFFDPPILNPPNQKIDTKRNFQKPSISCCTPFQIYSDFEPPFFTHPFCLICARQAPHRGLYSRFDTCELPRFNFEFTSSDFFAQPAFHDANLSPKNDSPLLLLSKKNSSFFIRQDSWIFTIGYLTFRLFEEPYLRFLQTLLTHLDRPPLTT